MKTTLNKGMELNGWNAITKFFVPMMHFYILLQLFISWCDVGHECTTERLKSLIDSYKYTVILIILYQFSFMYYTSIRNQQGKYPINTYSCPSTAKLCRYFKTTWRLHLIGLHILWKNETCFINNDNIFIFVRTSFDVQSFGYIMYWRWLQSPRIEHREGKGRKIV